MADNPELAAGNDQPDTPKTDKPAKAAKGAKAKKAGKTEKPAKAEKTAKAAAADNDEQHEHTFESVGAGASATYPVQCSALRKNGHVVIKGRPCRIMEMTTSKTGKHGHAKVHLVGIDIFTGKKLEELCPSTHNMDVPHVTRTEYQFSYIEDNFLHLISADSSTKDDVKVPEGDIGDRLREYDETTEAVVTITAAMGEEAATATKIVPTGTS